MNKLFELYKNKSGNNSQILFYEKLNENSYEFYNDLEKFMNNYKLI